MVVHFKHHCNTYGSLSAYIVAFAVRLSGGEPMLGLPTLIKFPGYDYEDERQLFPFRTMAMLMSLLTLCGVSKYTKYIFESGKLAPQYDYFRCVVNIPDDAVRVGDPSEAGEQVRLLSIRDFWWNFIRIFSSRSFLSWLVPWLRCTVQPQWLAKMK